MPLSLLRCISCGKEYPLTEIRFACTCGSLLDVIHDLPEIKKRFRLAVNAFDPLRTFSDSRPAGGVWRFRELVLPDVRDEEIVSKQEGTTRLHRSRSLSRWLDIGNLQLKHEGENPTGSFKDRGMTVAVTQATRLKERAVVCASTGNTSASLAAYAAESGLTGLVLIPEGQVAVGKISQALAYGAKTLVVKGDFDDCMRLIRESEEELGAYPLNSINPFRIEGQKTIIWETLAQRGWRVPDWFVFPGGNLGNTSAFGKALHEAKELGLIEKMPRFAVIQASGASPFYKAFRSGFSTLKPEKAETIATAIRIGNPANYPKAVRSIRWTDGIVESVSDEEILEAKYHVDAAGIGAEPASCATVAGIRKLVDGGIMRSTDDVVGILTGNLLKDPECIVKYHVKHPGPHANAPIGIEPTINALAKHLPKEVRR